MNIAANHAIYPQTATHLPYPNGAIIPSPLQQTASLASYPHMGPTGPAQSALVFNQAGQTFSIPLHAAHLSQIQSGNPGTAMYSTDGGPYYQPVTQLTAPNTGPKAARTDRLEIYSNNNSTHDALKSYLDLDTLYQQHLTHDEEGNYTNGYVTPYPNYTGATIQTIYTRAPSVDVKDATLINSNNGDALGPNGSSSSSTASTGANSGLKVSERR